MREVNGERRVIDGKKESVLVPPPYSKTKKTNFCEILRA